MEKLSLYFYAKRCFLHLNLFCNIKVCRSDITLECLWFLFEVCHSLQVVIRMSIVSRRDDNFCLSEAQCVCSAVWKTESLSSDYTWSLKTMCATALFENVHACMTIFLALWSDSKILCRMFTRCLYIRDIGMQNAVQSVGWPLALQI